MRAWQWVLLSWHHSGEREADLQEREVTIREGIIGYSGDKLTDVHYKSGKLIYLY